MKDSELARRAFCDNIADIINNALYEAFRDVDFDTLLSDINSLPGPGEEPV